MAKNRTREGTLTDARIAGYHNDTGTFTRLRIESRVAYRYLLDAWQVGVQQKRNGVRCSCREYSQQGCPR